MTRENKFTVVAAIVAIVLMMTGIFIGETKQAELEKIGRVERILNRTAELSGYKSLGVIDAYAISQRNGYTYDGPAVRAALFERAGMESPENCWVWTFDTFDGVTFMKIDVYNDDDTRPVTQREVIKTYLYGVI